MKLDEAREAQLQDLVGRLDALVPREGAHLTIPPDAGGRTTIGNRLGYLRFGVEFVKAALHPVPGSDEGPPRIIPRLDEVLSSDSAAPFELCELDESIVSRPPVQTRLGPLGQLLAAVLVVAVVILALIGGSLLWRRIFG